MGQYYFWRNGKFPKAIAATVLGDCTDELFKSPWMRVENHSATPLVTSDNPVCFWYKEPNRVPTTYFALTPALGILVKPFLDEKLAASYDHSMDDSAIAKPEFVNVLNELVIKHAEKIIISDQKSEGILEQVKIFQDWEYDCLISKAPTATGEYIATSLRAVRKDEDVDKPPD